MKKQMKVFLILIMCVAMLVMAGCQQQSNQPTEPQQTEQDNSLEDSTEATTDDSLDATTDDTLDDDLTSDLDDDLTGDIDADLNDDNAETNNWPVVKNLSEVHGLINNNGGTVNRDNEADGIVKFTFNEGNADNQLICQFAEAAEGVTAFEISTTVQPGATGRRGVGFKTPDGYLFFNVVNNGGDNGVGYVEFDVNTDGMKKDQAYQALDADAEAIITGDEAYTLKLVVTDINGAGTGTIEFYVNNTLVYSMKNTFTNAEGNPWNLSTKVLPAIGVRNANASATFSEYTFKAN